MTVRELIEKLQACDPDAIAMVHDTDDGSNYSPTEVVQRETTGYERGVKRKAPWWDEQPIDPPVHAVVIR